MLKLEERLLELDVPLEEKVVVLCLANVKTGIRLIDNHVADYNQEKRMATQEELNFTKKAA